MVSMTALRPALFFDRDGIVNQSPGPGYVLRTEEFHLQPEFVEALRIARRKGWPAVIVTNQRGVGKGLMTAAALEAIHAQLRRALAREGLELLDICSATSLDRSDPMLKPQPGMLLAAAERHGLDLAASWMIGDSERDIEAGRRAGCHTLLIGPDDPQTPSRAEARLDHIAELASFLERTLPSNL